MTEFVSRWLTPATTDDPDRCTDRTDKINSVSTVSASTTNSEPYARLDSAITASEASRWTLAAIEQRLARLTAQAARPTAGALDHQLVADWTAIRGAKLAGKEVA